MKWGDIFEFLLMACFFHEGSDAWYSNEGEPGENWGTPR